MSDPPFTALFEPERIAVIAAGEAADGIGQRVFDNIERGGFHGSVYLVNDAAARVAGAPVFVRVSDLPVRIDLALLAVPVADVSSVLRECGEHGVKFAVVLTSFATADPHVQQGFDDALADVRRSGLRVVGPNCLGIMRSSVKLNASVDRAIAQPGGLALVSQSSSLGSAIVDWAVGHNLGFSTVVCLGAACDVGLGEALDYLALDAATHTILLYVDHVEHARRFMSGLRAAARAKPVLVLKAFADDDALFDAAVRRAGAVRVTRLDALLATAQLLGRAPRLRGEGLAIVTNTVSLGVLANARLADLELPRVQLSAAAREHCATLLPEAKVDANTVDLGSAARSAHYRQALDICLADGAVDAVLVLLAPRWMTEPLHVAEILAASQSGAGKPLLVSFLGGPQLASARACMDEHDLPSFDAPEAAVEAFGHWVSYRRNQLLATQPAAAPTVRSPEVCGARSIIDAALARGATTLSRLESKAILRVFGIPVTAAARVSTADEALVAAEVFGFPVLIKIDMPETRANGELECMQVTHANEMHSAFALLTRSPRRHEATAHSEGVIVEPVVARPGARELSVGVRRDHALGPAILFQAGGMLRGVLGVAAVGMPPLGTSDANAMLSSRKFSCLLSAVDDRAPVDRNALVNILLRVSDLACELPEVEELAIDPLVADADGALALDARIRLSHALKSARQYAHLAIAPYPHQLVQTVHLADGAQLELRPIQAEDVRLEEAFISQLSLESRVFRFMNALARLTPDMLVRFTQLDYDRELALLAVESSAEGDEVAGIARYSAGPDGQRCEFAVVVADAWQKRGVGSQLMAALIQAARAQNLTAMHGDVLAENRRMLRWMMRLGFTVGPCPEDATVKRVRLALQ